MAESYEVARLDQEAASRVGPATVMAVGAAVGLAVGYLYLTDGGRQVRRQIDPWLDECLEEIARLRGAALKARRRGRKPRRQSTLCATSVRAHANARGSARPGPRGRALMMNDRDEYGYSNGSNAGSVMAGVVVGAAIGATLGLILAPRAGRETRQMISESGEKIRKQASNAYDQATSGVNNLVNRGRDAVSRGREAFASARDRAAEEVPRRVENAVDDIRSEFS